MNKFWVIQAENERQDDEIELTFYDESKLMIAWATLKEMANKGIINPDWMHLRCCEYTPNVVKAKNTWSTLAQWPEKGVTTNDYGS